MNKMRENKPHMGSDSLSGITIDTGKSPQNHLFQFLWKIPLNYALFGKIRQNCTSPDKRESRLNRGCFCTVFYTIRPPKSRQNTNMRVIFFDEGLKNGMFGINSSQ
jgi:hypothetical protein